MSIPSRRVRRPRSAGRRARSGFYQSEQVRRRPKTAGASYSFRAHDLLKRVSRREEVSHMSSSRGSGNSISMRNPGGMNESKSAPALGGMNESKSTPALGTVPGRRKERQLSTASTGSFNVPHRQHVVSLQRRKSPPCLSVVEIRRMRNKEYILSGKENDGNSSFPFQNLQNAAEIPHKRQHTPYTSTKYLITGPRAGERLSHHNIFSGAKVNGEVFDRFRPSSRCIGSRNSASVSATKQREDRRRHAARIQRRREAESRAARYVTANRFREAETSEKRVQSLVRQRVAYYRQLEQRFERDRQRQMAAGV